MLYYTREKLSYAVIPYGQTRILGARLYVYNGSSPTACYVNRSTAFKSILRLMMSI